MRNFVIVLAGLVSINTAVASPTDIGQKIHHKSTHVKQVGIVVPKPQINTLIPLQNNDIKVSLWEHPGGNVFFPLSNVQDANGKNLVALTFDDGPDNTYTPEIRQILKAKGITATFFLIGQRAKEDPQEVRNLIADGNEIGDHSETHPMLARLSAKRLSQEMSESVASITSASPGLKMAWFRPPYGDCDQAVVDEARKYGLETIRWSVDPSDWKNSNTSTEIHDSVVEHTRPGSVILLHSINARTVEALPSIIDDLKKQGYNFTTMTGLWNAMVAPRKTA